VVLTGRQSVESGAPAAYEGSAVPSSQPEAGEEIERVLAEVVRGLQAASGDNLLGVALYGSLVKGRYAPGVSDVNLLVVVADAGLTALLPLAPILTGAFRQAQVVGFVATPADLGAAARLYPAKILDLQLFHRRLHGDLHLADLVIDARELRYRTAQELKNMQLRLRDLRPDATTVRETARDYLDMLGDLAGRVGSGDELAVRQA
jgi:hypothetical protein